MLTLLLADVFAPVVQAPPTDRTTAVIAAVGAIAVTVGLIAQIFLQVLARQDAARVAAAAAAKVEITKATLAASTSKVDAKLDGIAAVALDTQKTGEQVHTLVNSNMGVQLRISMIALKRLADLTKDPDDIAAAEQATKLYREHEAKQAKVDEKDAKDAKKA